jgi:Protein of unknown function (DUF2953)
MVPVLLLVVGICVPLIIALSLFFVPIIVHVALGQTPESGYFLLRASWGWLGAMMRREEGESRQEFLLQDYPFYTRTVRDEESRAPEADEEPHGIPSLARRTHHLLRLIQPLSYLAGKFLHRMTLEEIRGRLKVGLRDPAETGILYGWYCAVLPVLTGSRVSLDVTPVFDRQVLEGEAMARIRIDRPLLLLLAMARLSLDRDVRDALSGLREG